MKNNKNFAYAFQQTIPIMCGYLFMGIAFGLLLVKSGYAPIWAVLLSIFVYAGSAQFMLVGLISACASLPEIAVMILTINSRHIFYGLSFIEKFKKMGARYLYMVFSLTDETYSLLCSVKIPEELDERSVHFSIAILDHLYWITGCTVGAVAGDLISFNATGIDFAMTALFVVIFIEQWLSAKNHLPAIIGVACAVIALVVIGPDGFILPALICAVGCLVLMRKLLESPEEETA